MDLYCTFSIAVVQAGLSDFELKRMNQNDLLITHLHF
jgi:hypothetical protein